MEESMHKKAKMSLLHDLRKMAMGMIHDGSGEEMPEPMMKGMQDAKEKAQGGAVDTDSVDADHDESSETPMEEAMESDEMQESENESPEHYKMQIEKLKAELAKYKK